jgi:IS5 family transposase
VVKQIHDRMVQIAREHRVAEGRRMRVDTTVVETNIHYPTDSSLLGDGVRVLTRTMKKIAGIAGAAGAKLRDRSRSVKLRMLEIARAARSKRSPSQTRLKEAYRKLLNATGRVEATPCTPRLVAADAGFYSAKNEAAAKAKGVKRVCIPNRSTKSPERKREQKKRWFRNGQKWRTGCEGRISVVKRRHGLDRSRYKGMPECSAGSASA